MNQANKIKLGAFIFFAAVLMVVSFIAFGLAQIFEPRIQALTVFGSTVEGLTVGSPVKFMGVPVGQVTRIAMRDSDGYVNVYFIIRRSAMDNIEDNSILDSPYNSFRDFFDNNNLSCFINAAGIMGGAYLELSTSSNAPYMLPNLKLIPPPSTIYIKSRTLHVTNVIANVSKTVDQLTKIDFVALADKVSYTMDSVNRIFVDKDLEESLERVSNISKDLEQVTSVLRGALTIERIDQTFNTVESVNHMLSSVAKAIPPKEVEQMVKELNEVLLEMNSFLKTSAVKRDEAVNELTSFSSRFALLGVRLNRFMNRTIEMIEAIEEQPDQLVRGKQSKTYFPPGESGIQQ
jgi:ABC-type transporter Mla subunit MlaD